MSTITEIHRQSHPPDSPPMTVVDRVALWTGLALIRWVDASQQHRLRRRRPGSYPAAREQAEADHVRSQQRAAALFWSFR